MAAWPPYARTLPLAVLLACGGPPTAPERQAAPLAPVAPQEAAPRPPPAPVLRHVPQASPYARTPSPELGAARASMTSFVAAEILRDPGNGWALAHGLLALGPDARMEGGEPVADALLSRFARRAGTDQVQIPRRSSTGAPLEPHEALVLKTLVELGFPPSHRVTVEGADASLADLWRGEVGSAWVEGGAMSFTSWGDTPWLLSSAATWAPAAFTWSAAGHTTTLDGFTHAAVVQLQADTDFLQRARAGSEPLQKRGQGIFGHPCGGAHFLQGVATAVAYGFGQPEDRAVLEAQARLHLWRFGQELAILDAAATAAPATFGLVLDIQRLKFAGHHLETIHRLATLGLLPPGDAEVEASLASGRAEILRAVASLEARGSYAHPEQVRAEREQSWLDLLGDSAHAVRGLQLDAGLATTLR